MIFNHAIGTNFYICIDFCLRRNNSSRMNIWQVGLLNLKGNNKLNFIEKFSLVLVILCSHYIYAHVADFFCILAKYCSIASINFCCSRLVEPSISATFRIKDSTELTCESKNLELLSCRISLLFSIRQISSLSR